ncbi:MAG: 2Fe-2S iron-sulfur cluster-binding protein, partial [Gammaproteobacteria bacterium]|nr:2Fe-2S iron-sulfur cluster-binding protein [Gammaproteobacteria bacterium]
QNILEAGLAQGLDLPYSCTGGVCSTCRVKLLKGDVSMAINYALEPWELEAGFVLACQCYPRSDELLLDYDQT